MSFHFQNPMPTSDEIKHKFPMTAEMTASKVKQDEAIRNILTNRSDRLIVVIGPCSADNEQAVCEYANRLSRLQDAVADRLVLVPRIYTNKPRTTGEGYKGMLHQPDPVGAPDVFSGMMAARRMHVRALTESGLGAADEILYPDMPSYRDDILSYVAVGARSVENQQHRLVASGIDQPVGMKNPTSGDFQILLNSITAAQAGHEFPYQGWAVHTQGNPLAHAVLRGSVSKGGRNIPNYHFEDLKRLWDLYRVRQLGNPVCLIDTNHANSGKNPREQARITLEVLHHRKISSEIRQLVKGFMIESYLVGGRQPVDGSVFGQSITDPCLGWEESSELVLRIADNA